MREMPDHMQLDQWKMALLEAVIVCGNRADSRSLVAWFMTVYDDKKTIENLGVVPTKYMRMDGKLAQGFNKILKGLFGKQIQIKKTEQLRKSGNTLLGGLQVLRLILDRYKTGDGLSRHYSSLDLEQLVWIGDSIEQMQRFRANVYDLESGLSTNIGDTERLEIYLDRMEASKILESKIDKFKERAIGHKKRTKDLLLQIIDDYVDLQRQKTNRKKKREVFTAKLKGNGGAPSGPAGMIARVDAEGVEVSGSAMLVKSQSICHAYLKGQCRKSKKDCFYAHPDNQEGTFLKTDKGGKKGGKGGGKGKKGEGEERGRKGGKGKGGKRSDSPHGNRDSSVSSNGSHSSKSLEEKKKIFCSFLANGKCSFGESCHFSHNEKHRQGRPQAKPKPKAKAKGLVGKTEPPAPLTAEQKANKKMAKKEKRKVAKAKAAA
jgi:hypothetical protein